MVVSVRPLKHAPTILFAHARVMLPARDSTSDNVVDFACAKLAGIQTVIQVRVLWEAHSVTLPAQVGLMSIPAARSTRRG